MLQWLILKYRILFLKMWRVASAVFSSDGRISKYPTYVTAFEQNFADYIGCQYGMSFCNGTSALEAALFAVGVKEGDEVLVSSCSIHAPAAAILKLGARPVFVDINPESLNFDPEEITQKVTPKTTCLIVVHLWSNPADMEPILRKAKACNLKVIEDASHIHGGTWRGEKLGSLGDVGCFSLQGYKAISAGEGGITVTNNQAFHDRLTLYGHFGRNADSIKKTALAPFLPTGIDSKRRANPLGICMASVDLQFIDRVNQQKRRFIQKLHPIIASVTGLKTIKPDPESVPGGFFPAYALLIQEGFESKAVLAQLNKQLKRKGLKMAYLNKVPKPHYHQMRQLYDPSYRKQLITGVEPNREALIATPNLPHTETVLERVIFIPIGYSLRAYFKRF